MAHRPARADARLQPAAAPAHRAGDRHGSLGRLDHGRVAAAGAGGSPGRRGRGDRDQRHGEGQGAAKEPVAVPVRSLDDGRARSILDEPAPRSGQSPDQPDGLDRRRRTAAAARASVAPGVRGRGGTLARPRLAGDAPTALESLNAIDWTLPDDRPARAAPGGAWSASTLDHASNTRRIEEKLLSFSIPAKVVAVNSGPVVTQYEVRPEHHVKVSRIEALADDLAMALAARSIRIEAPIPGKDVVGIEIPNSVSEVVGFRPLVDESQMLESTSPLTFALGRDVSGKAYAVDLAKMPHLLVAGATGSGKSVCVNALITSLLMRARPDEVRMILVDLKRVELAPYNGLPHLLQHVIVEPNEAKAVLNWAVREMEERYKLLAAHSVRNIAAFNARPEANGCGPRRRRGRRRDDGTLRRRRRRRADALHRPDHRRAGRPDHARGPQGRGPGRQDRPEGAGRRASTSCSPRSGRRSTS